MTPAKRLDADLIRAEFFDQGHSVAMLSERYGATRQAIEAHLRSDPRYVPTMPEGAVWEDGKWQRQSTKGNRLATQIRRVAARRTRALEAAETAYAELLPLLDLARREGPEHLTNAQLGDLTGITKGHISWLVKHYRAKMNGEASE